MSHPVGARHGVHHGLANAVILPHVMEYNLQARIPEFAAIAAALGEDTDGGDFDAACLALEAVRRLNADLDIPPFLCFAGWRIRTSRDSRRPPCAAGNVQVNPRKTTLSDMEELFRIACGPTPGGTMPFPRMMKVRQHFEAPEIGDIPGTVKERIGALNLSPQGWPGRLGGRHGGQPRRQQHRRHHRGGGGRP